VGGGGGEKKKRKKTYSVLEYCPAEGFLSRRNHSGGRPLQEPRRPEKDLRIKASLPWKKKKLVSEEGKGQPRGRTPGKTIRREADFI